MDINLRRVNTTEEMRVPAGGGDSFERRVVDREAVRELLERVMGKFGYRRLPRAIEEWGGQRPEPACERIRPGAGNVREFLGGYGFTFVTGANDEEEIVLSRLGRMHRRLKPVFLMGEVCRAPRQLLVLIDLGVVGASK